MPLNHLGKHINITAWTYLNLNMLNKKRRGTEKILEKEDQMSERFTNLNSTEGKKRRTF